MSKDKVEEQWPELKEFREACLSNDYAGMERIAARSHDWYASENPEQLSMAELASIYQAQCYAISGNLPALKKVIEEHPWTVNKPWTAQAWLPITQAAFSHGDQELIEYLLERGADPTLSVGSPYDRATVVEMARLGGIRIWLNGYRRSSVVVLTGNRRVLT